MTTISSRTDIETYVANAHPDFVTHGLVDALVDAIQGADHPAFGSDWGAWLDENVEALRVGVAS